MSSYKILDKHGLNFVTCAVVDWVDVFIRKSYKDIIIECRWREAAKKRNPKNQN